MSYPVEKTSQKVNGARKAFYREQSAAKRPTQSIGRTLSAVLLGSLALLILGMQPLLYGGFVREGVIAEDALGLLSAAEVIAITTGSAAAIPILRRFNPVWIGLIGIAMNCSGNLVPLSPSSPLLLAGARACAGLGSGLLLGISAAAIANTSRIGNWTAASLFGQAATQFAVMNWFALYAPDAPTWEIQRGLVLVMVAATALVFTLPRNLAAGANSESETVQGSMSQWPDRRGLHCLLAMALYTGGAVAMWAYASLWMNHRGIATAAGAMVLTINLAGQALGSLVSMLVPEGRHDWARAVAMTALFVLSSVAWLISPGMLIFGFCYGLFWMSGAPALASVLAAVDPGRKAVPFAAAAQLAGIALIPTIFGVALGARSLDVLAICAIATVAVSGLLLLSLRPSPRTKM